MVIDPLTRNLNGRGRCRQDAYFSSKITQMLAGRTFVDVGAEPETHISGIEAGRHSGLLQDMDPGSLMVLAEKSRDRSSILVERIAGLIGACSNWV